MKLVNINIEGDRHYETVLPFLAKESPDVFCAQEVFEEDISLLTNGNYTHTFLPITLKKREAGPTPLGVLMAAKLVHTTFNVRTYYYHHEDGVLAEFNDRDKDITVNNGVILADITIDGTNYTVATTHFTWVPHGDTPTLWQRNDMTRFLIYMGTQEPHILTGDLNIPRYKNPLFDELTKHYTDAIPETYTSSLDKSKHRLGNKTETAHLFTDYMVDHLLVQAPYHAHDVRLEFGISDHAAVVAEIHRKDTM